LSLFYVSGTSRHMRSQTATTSGLWTNGDVAHRNQNGGGDVDLRYAVRVHGSLEDEGLLSTRSSPIHRTTKTTTDLRQHHSHSVNRDDPLRPRTTHRAVPGSTSSRSPEPWWSQRYRGQWVDSSFDHRSATVGRTRDTLTVDSDKVDRPGHSRSTACLLETRCDGRSAPVTVAVSPNT